MEIWKFLIISLFKFYYSNKKMARYSVSQIQVYQQCPLKYRYRYVDKIPTPEFVETTDTLL